MMPVPSQPVRTELARPCFLQTGKKNRDKKKKLDKDDIGTPIAETLIHVTGRHLIEDPVIALMLNKTGIPFEEIGKTTEERARNIEMIKRQTMKSGDYRKYEEKLRRSTMRINAKQPPPCPGPPPPPTVTRSEKPPPPAKPTPGRGAFLDEIAKGAKLKHVDIEGDSRPNNAKAGTGPPCDLSDVLAKRLKEVCFSSDEETDDDDDDDDEWDDK